MSYPIVLIGYRQPLAVDCPRDIRRALRVLGLPVPRNGNCQLLDRDLLAYDARVAFKVEIRTAHPDVGGCSARAIAVVEAYRLVKRFCAQRYVVPRTSAQKRATVYDDL